MEKETWTFAMGHPGVSLNALLAMRSLTIHYELSIHLVSATHMFSVGFWLGLGWPVLLRDLLCDTSETVFVGSGDDWKQMRALMLLMSVLETVKRHMGLLRMWRRAGCAWELGSSNQPGPDFLIQDISAEEGELRKRAAFEGRQLFSSDDLAAWFEAEWSFLWLFKLRGTVPFI